MTSKFTIVALPEEILIKIFSHLIIEDLKSLSLTCTKISQIINECPEIVKKFQLILTSESDVLGKFEVRKPYHVKSIMDETEKLYKIEIKIAKYIRTLTIECKDCDYSKLMNFLNQCERLKELSLTMKSDIKLPQELEVENKSSKFLKLNLEKLTICGNLEILKLFKNCKIKSLITNGKFNLNANEFPKMFPNIKSLSMNPSDQEICFSDFAQLESLHFKLELLTMELQLPKSLKKLSLEVSNYKINKPFDYKNNNIKELTIFEYKKLDWLDDFLADPSTNLDKLTLNIQTYRKESKDELDQAKSIKKYSKKIKKININIQNISKIPNMALRRPFRGRNMNYFRRHGIVLEEEEENFLRFLLAELLNQIEDIV